MAKRLCKMNRKQIAENLGDIHRLVVEPKFVCRSCARSAADKNTLCKPAAIPPKQCQSKPLEQQKTCGLLAEALPSSPPVSQSRAEKVRSVIERVKKKSDQDAVCHLSEQERPQAFSLTDKRAIKQASKMLKKQHKAQKKLIKLAKKQLKLAKKQKKLEQKAEQTPRVKLPEMPLTLARENNLH